MGADIHASIEYSDDYGQGRPILMTLTDFSLDRNYTMFGALGYVGRSIGEPVVPVRGWPKDGEFYGDIGWGFRREATALVVQGAAARNLSFDEYGSMHEGDGIVLNREGADRWLKIGSIWLPRNEGDTHEDAEYRYISNPDIHSVNWITANEFWKAIVAVEMGDEFERDVSDYRAVLDAMRAIEKPKRSVRLIYGFDN